MRVLRAAAASVLAILPCDVPVFRYALEHWPAEPYVLILRSGGAPGPAEAAVLETIGRQVRAGANLEVRRVEDGRPGAVLQYPDSAGIARTVWEGRLADLSVEGLLDSPVRRLVVRKIQEGAAAVWILLESGDPASDAAASRFLEECLQEALARGFGRGVGVEGGPGARPVFPLVRLSRADPAEEMLVRMLLRSEEGLEEAAGPMAFPVFGRGRKLEALVGKGISAENVAEYAAFLTGPCSCQVKLQNPGVDLLLAADWEGGRGGSTGGGPLPGTPPSPAAGGVGMWGWILLALGAAGVAAAGGFFLIRGRRPS